MTKARNNRAKAAARPKHYTGSEIGREFTKMLEEFRADRVREQGGIVGNTLSSDDPYYMGKQKSRLEYAVARFAFRDENDIYEACTNLTKDEAVAYTMKVDRAKKLLTDLNKSPSYDKNYRGPWVNFENFILQVARAHRPSLHIAVHAHMVCMGGSRTAPAARMPPLACTDCLCFCQWMPGSADAEMVRGWASGAFKFGNFISPIAHELHVNYLLTDMDKACNPSNLPGLMGRECQWPTGDMFQKASGYLHDTFCRTETGQARACLARPSPTHTRPPSPI